MAVRKITANNKFSSGSNEIQSKEQVTFIFIKKKNFQGTNNIVLIN